MQRYHALVDYASNAILTMGANAQVIRFLEECISESQPILSINAPNYGSPFKRLLFASIRPKAYPQWIWDKKKRILTKTNAVSQNLQEKSRLAEGKRKLLATITGHLNSARSKVIPGVLFQDTIYLKKQLQAASFRSSGYDEDSILEFPYVAQYADYAGISYKEAADDILLKAKLDDQQIANTELLRLKFFNEVKKAASLEELPHILKEFRSDSFYE